MTITLHVYVEGTVQGVGFRHATFVKATSLGLSGWVRNLNDGGVEAMFDGPKPLLDDVLKWCRQGPAFASVRAVQEQWGEAPNPSPDFRVVF